MDEQKLRAQAARNWAVIMCDAELHERAKPFVNNLITRRRNMQLRREPVDNKVLHIAADHPALPYIRRLREITGGASMKIMGFPVEVKDGPPLTWEIISTE